MASQKLDPTREADYQAFMAELTTLSRRYGIAIHAVGGVLIADQAGDWPAVTYTADSSSGDLYPEFD